MKTQIILFLIVIAAMFQLNSCVSHSSNPSCQSTFLYKELLDTTVLFSRYRPSPMPSEFISFYPDSTFEFAFYSGGCTGPWTSTIYSGKAKFFNQGRQLELLPDSIFVKTHSYDFENKIDLIDSLSADYAFFKSKNPLEEKEFWVIPWKGSEYLIEKKYLENFIIFTQDNYEYHFRKKHFKYLKNDSITLQTDLELKSYLDQSDLEYLFISENLSTEIMDSDTAYIVDDDYRFQYQNTIYYLKNGFKDSIFQNFIFIGQSSRCTLRVLESLEQKATGVAWNGTKCEVGEKVFLQKPKKSK